MHKLSIISHGVGVEASFPHLQDVIRWRQSKTTGVTHDKQFVVRHCARANNGIVAGNTQESDTTNTGNNLLIKIEAEEVKLHRLAKDHELLVMYQAS